MEELRDGDGSEHTIDHRTFAERLQALYLHWRKHKDELWGSADFFAIATPPTDDICYHMPSELHVWLLGYEFPETVTVFGDKHIHFLCNQKKARLLKTMKRSAKEAVDVDVVIHAMRKGEDGTSKMDDVLHSMRMSKSDVNSAPPIVGYLVDEPPKGSLSKKWADKLNNFGFQLSDVTDGLSSVFAINNPDEITYEKEERQHWEELLRQKIEDTARRLVRCNSASGDKGADSKTSNELTAYWSVYDLPPPPSKMMIQVDVEKEVVLLPINGIMVPFHLATVKRVSSLQGPDHDCYLGITFKAPFTPHDNTGSKNEGAIYLKEASFYSKDPRHISEVVYWIKKLTLKRNALARESERRLVKRPTMVISQTELLLVGKKSKTIRLAHLCIHPSSGGPANMIIGALEAHVNGFRYSTSRHNEWVDVMYSNIKHAFFQPAEIGEVIVLLHFHLHNHIMVGNKKTKDVQFYIEDIGQVETLGGENRLDLDLCEIIEGINMEFEDFVNKVHDQPEFKALGLGFEHPLKEHAFFGRVVPHNKGSSAMIVPTSNCLVQLKLCPFLIINLSEIEIVNLERISAGQMDFDMVIVFKDFKRDVMRIDSIPASSFRGIKAWLHTTDIEYFECSVNLHWRAILKTFIDDPQAFIDSGGWGFMVQKVELML